MTLTYADFLPDNSSCAISLYQRRNLETCPNSCRRQPKYAQIGSNYLRHGGKRCKKRENADHQDFLFFSHCFQKALSSTSLKLARDGVTMGLINPPFSKQFSVSKIKRLTVTSRSYLILFPQCFPTIPNTKYAHFNKNI